MRLTCLPARGSALRGLAVGLRSRPALLRRFLCSSFTAIPGCDRPRSSPPDFGSHTPYQPADCPYRMKKPPPSGLDSHIGMHTAADQEKLALTRLSGKRFVALAEENGWMVRGQYDHIDKLYHISQDSARGDEEPCVNPNQAGNRTTANHRFPATVRRRRISADTISLPLAKCGHGPWGVVTTLFPAPCAFRRTASHLIIGLEGYRNSCG